MADPVDWLLRCDEPWTRYRTLIDVLKRPESDPDVVAARTAMVDHPQVRALIAGAAAWPGPAIKRHNDATHPIYQIATLADMGLRAGDPGIDDLIAAIAAHQSREAAFQSVVNVAVAFGGSGEDEWTWLLCDSPTLLYALLAMGAGSDARVQRAVEHLAGLAADNGYRCVAAPELGKFHGPGRRSDPCPIANVYALKALAFGGLPDGPAAHLGAEALLGHWARRDKMYLFGAGTDFRKLKYPFVWYDLLHVAHVLSHLPFVHADPRYQEMLACLAAQAGPDGRYTAGSMYQAWKGWSFADKKHPSPWLTYLALKVLKG